MSAVTADNVIVTEAGWTQLSTATIQTLQLLAGSAGVIYAASQPTSSIQVGGKGHVLNANDYLNNTEGGTSWGRAENGSVSAHFGITEG